MKLKGRQETEKKGEKGDFFLITNYWDIRLVSIVENRLYKCFVNSQQAKFI
mgnify:CR=1 FL=1